MLNGLSLTWSWNPWAIAFLLLLSLLYLLGLRHIHRHHPYTMVKPIRPLAFFTAIVIGALLLLTPLETIGRTQLFSVHMAQIVLLITLCAPLIMAGCPEEMLHPLIETPGVRHVLRFIINPLVASIIFNVGFLLWHTPKIYSITQQNATFYDIMMVSIFFFSFLNWHPLIGALHKTWHMTYPMQMLYAFFDGQPVDIFAFVLVFTQVALYPLYHAPSQFALPQLGMGTFPDQAAGGALLLIPGLVDLGVMTPFFFRWLADIETRTQLTDQKRQQELENFDDEEEEWEEDDSEER